MHGHSAFFVYRHAPGDSTVTRTFATALALVFLLASNAVASPFAQSYADGFVDHWTAAFAKRNTIVIGVLIAGAVGIFIITRGKRMK